MLVLTRRLGESVVIGKNVRFTVLSINGNSVRVGITAPKDVQVHREEVFRAIQKQQANER
jgi:carbon storage regulator